MKALVCLLCICAVAAFVYHARATDTPPQAATVSSWQSAKTSQIPHNELEREYEAPSRQPMAGMAWEDGVYITRDGLSLYCTYEPLDLLSAFFGHSTPDKFYLYRRGTDIGQDFTSPATGASTPWLHADIAVATRASIKEPFGPWKLTHQREKFYNNGGAQGILNAANPGIFDYFVYTNDEKGHTAIMMLTGTDRALSGTGKLLPANVDRPGANEDNPHIEHADANDPRKLVLFFDSDNFPGGLGAHDLWYTLSADAGATWSDPRPVASLNTPAEEEQPHLYFDGASWWLYFSATDPVTKGLAIYRAKQGQPSNWDDWKDRQLVVSAGSAMSVGEPTLTAQGDLSFVVITRNNQGTDTDRYDADPWLMKKR